MRNVFNLKTLAEVQRQIDAYLQSEAEKCVTAAGYDITTTVGQQMVGIYKRGHEQGGKDFLKFFTK